MTQDHDQSARQATSQPVYRPAARHLHWATAAGVFVMLPLGFAMTYRGETMEVWDGITNAMFSTHKLLGFLLLWLVACRLLYRLLKGAPPDEPSLRPWQKHLSHAVHWLLYGLLLVVPLLGWIGISLYPSLTIFGLFDLPALTGPDQPQAERALAVHGLLARVLMVLAALHVGAALQHHFLRRDGVLRRMLPGLKPRG